MHWITRRPRAVELFAVEPERAQLVWRRAGPGQLSLQLVGSNDSRRKLSVESDGGPGSQILEELQPATSYELTLSGPGLATVDRHHRFMTPPNPPGELLTRLATVGDVHIGSDRFGFLKTIRESPEPEIRSSERCFLASIGAITHWGVDHVIFKGDIVNHGTAEEWQTVQRIFAELPFEFEVILGNHEANAKRGVNPNTGEAAAAFGHTDPVRVTDLPGIRVVLADTPIGCTNRGDISHVSEAILDAAAAAETPVLVCVHHNFQPHRMPTFLPAGIPGHHAKDFLDRLLSVAPASMTISGHTHRNRRLSHRSMPVVEVGSPKDYPGVWAGYAIHEGGIRQVSYRVTQPDCLAWTYRTRWAALGVWGRWAPGEIDDRCFTHLWPDTQGAGLQKAGVGGL